MDRLTTVLSDAFRQVCRHDRLVTANLTGNAFLGLVFFFWASSSALGWREVLRAIPMLTALGFFLMWLHATTLAAFHPGVARTPFMPALRRLPQFFPWALALAAVLALFEWLASVLGIFVWVVGLTAILSLLPLASQAAGGGFSFRKAQDIVFDEVYWMAATLLAVGGLYLPVLVFSWNPQTDNLILKLVAASIRVGLPYSLAVTSWVLLAAVIGRLGAGEAAPERSSGAGQAAGTRAITGEESPEGRSNPREEVVRQAPKP